MIGLEDNDLINYLRRTENIEQLNDEHICRKRDFDTYKSFYDFVKFHYNLKHLQENNYIKYVKVMRHILIVKHEDEYNKRVNEMNDILLILSKNNILSFCNIIKFFYKMNTLEEAINDRKIVFKNTLESIREILNSGTARNEFKLLYAINNLVYKIMMLEKYGKKLLYLAKKYIDWEYKFGIDHTMIRANNHRRCYLGLMSESYSNKIISKYVNELNENSTGKYQYFYEKNIDMIKLFNIDAKERNHIKGEIDGAIISFDGEIYRIEYIIEVKSSIKSTFEDIEKLKFLQTFISNYDWEENENVKYDNYIFNRDSFEKIIKNELKSWCVYICIINDDGCIVEKSNIYFYTVLKILDNIFIKKYYIENDESIINEKYNIVCNNMNYINTLFEEWKDITGFSNNNCNIFVSKRGY